MPNNCGSLYIEVDGLTDSTKTNPGLLVLRNYSSNGAPRKRVTFYGGSCSSTTDCLVTCSKPTKLRLWDSPTGGSIIPWNQHFAIQSIKTGKELYLEGLEASASTGDILVSLVQAPSSSTDCYCSTDSFKVTVLWCDVSARFTNEVSVANDKREYYRQRVGTYMLGKSTWPANNSAQAGIELVGTVKPTDFNPGIWGNLSWVRYIKSDGQYSGVGGSTPIGSAPPDTNDTVPESQDIDPSGIGQVYDVDAPAVFLPNTSSSDIIRRMRTNFSEWISYGGCRISAELYWYVALSAYVQNGVIDFNTSVSGDNRVETGSTPTTWNLQ